MVLVDNNTWATLLPEVGFSENNPGKKQLGRK